MFPHSMEIGKSRWFRLWPDGPGLIALHRSMPVLFSERNGYRRFWRIGSWRFGILRTVRHGNQH